MIRLMIVTLLTVFFTGTSVSAQTSECPPGTHTVTSLQDRILEIAATEGPGERIAALVSRALARRPMPGCTLLRDDVDRQAAMEELIGVFARQADPTIESYVLIGVSGALASPGEAQLTMPLAALADAVEEAGSGSAGYLLLQRADIPSVGEYLLAWARAERGPPGRPNWPSELVQVLIQFPASSQESLRAQVISDPSLIRNPRARCLVDHRNRHDAPPCPDPGTP